MGNLKNFLSRIAFEKQASPSKTPGRNDQCWCGSGKKYKKCHLEEDEKKRDRNSSANCGSTCGTSRC
jgi:hypothetical protein